MKKSLDDLQRDFTTLFQRFTAFVGELTALRANEATLATRRHGA